MAQRNPALDFFRGLALLVIFVNHMPGNPWYWYTPSRFGFSDAAEGFVFLSGYAGALAYGPRFAKDGFWNGTQRVMRRWLQIYAAHLASFGLMWVVCVIANRWAPEMHSLQRLNLSYLLDAAPQAWLQMLTLVYVPGYFDILPLYLALLPGLPLFWLLSRIHFTLAIAASLGLYCAADIYGWQLIGNPRTGQPWYFNPMNWQLLFFSGFACASGWLKLPEKPAGGLGLAVLLLLLAIPLAYQPLYSRIELFGVMRAMLEPGLEKTHLGGLRWLHLLALAYLLRQLLHRRRQWLDAWLSRLLITLGQHSLPMYLAVMALSYLAGSVLLRSSLPKAIAAASVNLGGILLLLTLGQCLARWPTARVWLAEGSRESRRALSTHSG